MKAAIEKNGVSEQDIIMIDTNASPSQVLDSENKQHDGDICAKFEEEDKDVLMTTEKEDDLAEILELMDTLIDRIECRWQVVDDGDPKAFPDEGMCWVALHLVSQPKYKGEEGITRVVMWPAWLISVNKEDYSTVSDDGNASSEVIATQFGATITTNIERGADGKEGRENQHSALDHREGLRTVCCYGDGRFIRVKMSSVQPFESKSRQGTSRGGLLWNTAVKQAQARIACPAQFSCMISQNLDYCAAPVLLGRLWRVQQEAPAGGYKLTKGDVLAVKWNTVDWWPAQVSAVRQSGHTVEVKYEDDGGTRLTMRWPEDDAYLLREADIEYDSDDAELLEDGCQCTTTEVENFVRNERLGIPHTKPAAQANGRENGNDSDDDHNDINNATSANDPVWEATAVEDKHGSDGGDESEDEKDFIPEGSSGVTAGKKKGKMNLSPNVISHDSSCADGVNKSSRKNKKKTAKSDSMTTMSSKKGCGLSGSKERKVIGKKEKEASESSPQKKKSTKAKSPASFSKDNAIKLQQKAQQKAHQEAKASADALRKSVRQRLQSVLKIETMDEKKAASKEAGVANPPIMDSATLAAQVEREIFQQTRGDDTIECGGESLVGTAYKRKLRQLAFNLRKNLELRARVCTGKLEANKLVKLDAESLAPKAVQQQRQAAREQALQDRDRSARTVTAIQDMVDKASALARPKARREALELTAMLDNTINPKQVRRTMTIEDEHFKKIGSMQKKEEVSTASSASSSSMQSRGGVGRMRKRKSSASESVDEIFDRIANTRDMSNSMSYIKSTIDPKTLTMPTFEKIRSLEDEDDADNDKEHRGNHNSEWDGTAGKSNSFGNGLPSRLHPNGEASGKALPPPSHIDDSDDGDDEPYDPDNDDIDIDPTTMIPGTSAVAAQAAAAAAAAATPPKPNIRLPAGWEARFSKRKGAWYFVEENTGESRWDPPPLPKAGRALSLLNVKASRSTPIPSLTAFSRVVTGDRKKGVSFATGPDTVLDTQDTRGIDELEGAILSGDVNKVREMTLADEQLLVELVNQKEDLLEKMEELLSKHENEEVQQQMQQQQEEEEQRTLIPQPKAPLLLSPPLQSPCHMQSNSLHKGLDHGLDDAVNTTNHTSAVGIGGVQSSGHTRSALLPTPKTSPLQSENRNASINTIHPPSASYQHEDGSWDCPRCGNHNFSSRNFCNMRKCGAPKPGGADKRKRGRADSRYEGHNSDRQRCSPPPNGPPRSTLSRDHGAGPGISPAAAELQHAMVTGDIKIVEGVLKKHATLLMELAERSSQGVPEPTRKQNSSILDRLEKMLKATPPELLKSNKLSTSSTGNEPEPYRKRTRRKRWDNADSMPNNSPRNALLPAPPLSQGNQFSSQNPPGMLQAQPHPQHPQITNHQHQEQQWQHISQSSHISQPLNQAAPCPPPQIQYGNKFGMLMPSPQPSSNRPPFPNGVRKTSDISQSVGHQSMHHHQQQQQQQQYGGPLPPPLSSQQSHTLQLPPAQAMLQHQHSQLSNSFGQRQLLHQHQGNERRTDMNFGTYGMDAASGASFSGNSVDGYGQRDHRRRRSRWSS